MDLDGRWPARLDPGKDISPLKAKLDGRIGSALSLRAGRRNDPLEVSQNDPA